VYAITGKAKDIIAVVKACLTEKEPGVRAAAAETLGEMGAAARDADRDIMAALERLTADSEEAVKRAAADAMRRIDPRAARPRLP
jgi:hypothetical protein